ncbi:MAG TPA: protein kinase [Gaiellaceae bacterium]|nr:protein kinase [Gaiellaceae bacterium]
MVGELIAGRYELEKLVGSGGMSNVFRAHDRLLERTVALKILHEQYTRDEDYVERFRREARAVAQLTHPNIVTVIDRGEQEGRQFIVFEYIDGENLKELSNRGPLEVREAIRLTLQVARALAFAHERGLVHRDVKPQNVLLNEDGQAKVTDFGIARSLDVHGVTQTGTVLGTSDYIAPEQARGQKVDPKTDIYSLGVVLYELLSGEVPFSGDNFVAVAMRHVNEPAPSVLDTRPDCPMRLAVAIQRAMSKDPEERFPSMGDFAVELEACLAEIDGRGDEGATMIVPAPRRPRRERSHERPAVVMPLVLAALVVALLAAGAFLLFHTGGGKSVLQRDGAAPSKPVTLHGVTAYDPFGNNGQEHDNEAAKATDGNPSSGWTTEHYREFTKAGVGLVLSAPRAVALSRLTVVAVPGFEAKIQASNLSNSGFVDVSGDWQTVVARTSFKIDTHGKDYRYYMVWLRLPSSGGQAEIDEVTART